MRCSTGVFLALAGVCGCGGPESAALGAGTAVVEDIFQVRDRPRLDLELIGCPQGRHSPELARVAAAWAERGADLRVRINGERFDPLPGLGSSRCDGRPDLEAILEARRPRTATLVVAYPGPSGELTLSSTQERVAAADARGAQWWPARLAWLGASSCDDCVQPDRLWSQLEEGVLFDTWPAKAIELPLSRAPDTDSIRVFVDDIEVPRPQHLDWRADTWGFAPSANELRVLRPPIAADRMQRVIEVRVLYRPAAL